MTNKHFIISTGILICLLSGIKLRQKPEQEITRIKVTYKSPDRIVNNEGEFFFVEFYISFFNKYRIYELPYHKTQEINNILIYDSVKYEYLVCNSQKKMGYLFKTLTDTIGKLVNSDSIINTRALRGGNGHVISLDEERIISIDKLKADGDEQIFRYLFKKDFHDSAYFYYNKKLKPVEFSFSRSLDSIHDSKLYRVELFITHNKDTVPPGLHNFYINSVDFVIEPASNKAALQTLLDRFIQKEDHFK